MTKRTLQSSLKILAIAFALIIVSSSLAGENWSPYSTASATLPTTGPTFVWFFGYIGDTFYPQTQLNISTTQMLSAAANMSAKIGKANLRLVSSVGDEPGRNLTSGSVPTVRSYVHGLRAYASVVYAVLDLLEYNTTSNTSLYNRTSFYVNFIHVNGIFLDHAAPFYASVGEENFSLMMQNLTKSFPTLSFIVNGGLGSFKNHTSFFITPEANTTWAAATYINPTVAQGTYQNVSFGKIATLDTMYPGKVLVHLDSFALNSRNPMGVFADQNSTTEDSAVQYIALNGAFPNSSSDSYSFLYPVIGAWTYNGSLPPSNIDYNGTLYNSLSIGNFARGTFASFLSTMYQSAHKISDRIPVSCPKIMAFNETGLCTGSVTWTPLPYGNSTLVSLTNTTVIFRSSGGNFSNENCTLVSPSDVKCEVSFLPTTLGNVTVVASFSGDMRHTPGHRNTVTNVG